MSTKTEFWPSTTPLPSPSSLKRASPTTEADLLFQCHARRQIEQILDGVDHRLLLVVGPCSIHNTTAAFEYARKLHELSKNVSSTLLLVMRTYFEKPRTALGWPGMLYDPGLDGGMDVTAGIKAARELLLSLSSLGLPTATEFLTHYSPQYFGELISWGCIGARTVSSQPHRQLASALPMPMGFKNATDGSVSSAVHAIITAREPHRFIAPNSTGQNCIVESIGNPYSHLILRGGEARTNYHPDTVADAMQALLEAGLPPRLMIDCSHDNCRKIADRQPAVFQDVIEQILGGNQNIVGVMLESNLEAGKSSEKENSSYGVSLTDPCIGWETTEELVLWAHNRLSSSKKNSCWATVS